ncbi:hypothetical protein NONI108955_26860 [Nocardia ninae]|uniref:Uncharacterized protein n=1 Tax=Nocardia ninae NBRC 108245 TaxID=1210091 RepID=A0A511MP35_9NOCA|nr:MULTISPECIES: hypothetical protein [Nocardia]GEM42380.1 hypothetical protein NN4_68990 [Nocardia ninae NBRC 108245]
MSSFSFDWVLAGQNGGDPLAAALYGPLSMMLNILAALQTGEIV